MKEGRTIAALAQELTDRKKEKHDFLADTRKLTAFSDSNRIKISGLPMPETQMQIGPRYDVDIACERALSAPALSQHALRQVGSRLNIPAKYVDRMAEDAPDLLATNINHWFEHEPETRLVRTNNQGVRAFLSNRYRIIDNEEIAEAVLPILAEIPDLKIESCEVTDTKMYIKAVDPRIQGDVVGQIVQGGVCISNSEIGMGSVSVKPMAFELRCLNGWITDKGLSKYHIGRQSSYEERVREIISDETMEADDRALMLKLRDVLKASLDQVQFDKTLNKMRDAHDVDIGDPVKAIEVIEKKGWLSKDEGKSVLKHLIEGGDLSVLGLGQAVTRASQDHTSYDRATDMEKLGGDILELPKTAWTTEMKMAA